MEFLSIHVLLRSVTDRKITLLRSVIDRNPVGSDNGRSSISIKLSMYMHIHV